MAILKKACYLNANFGNIFSFHHDLCRRNSFVQSFLYDQQIHGLKKEIQHYQGVIEEKQNKLNELQSNKKNLEKFAREQYLMKKDNEDIYIITEEEQK